MVIMDNSNKTFFELFHLILRGNKEDSRMSAREVRKLLYSSRDGGKYEDIKLIIDGAPMAYNNIKEVWREENFVQAISVLYFLHKKDNDPDFLFPWLFYLLKHQNGNIRHAAVRMLTNELGPLTVHLRHPKSDHERNVKQDDDILHHLFMGLNKLSTDLWQTKYKKYKYIDSLPACPYKSVQIILSTFEDYCGKPYIKRIEKTYFEPR